MSPAGPSPAHESISVIARIDDCIVADQGAVCERPEAEALDWRVRQPVHGDPIFEVTCGPISFYLSGIHEQAPLAATAFAASHFGTLLNEPHDSVAHRCDKVKAIVTSMARTIIRPAEPERLAMPGRLPERLPESPLDVAPLPQCLTERLAHACTRSHATMTFDPDDLAAKLRLIAHGHAPEYVSYLALCAS